MQCPNIEEVVDNDLLSSFESTFQSIYLCVCVCVCVCVFNIQKKEPTWKICNKRKKTSTIRLQIT